MDSPLLRPCVAIWRSAWLPRSETFIRDHVNALARYDPLLLGLWPVDGGLELTPDRAPFRQSGWRRGAWSVARRIGYPGVYSSVLARSQPRLVHAHFGTDAVEVLPVVRRHRLPLVVTFHGYDLSTALEGGRSSLYRERLGELWSQAAALLPVSDELEHRLLELGAPPHKVIRHYLGINIDEPVRRVSPGRGVVYVGRLIARKGAADLIDAISRLPAPLRRATPVTIIGDGPLRTVLERKAAAVPEADFRFMGTQPSSVVAEVLRHAAVFCGPSMTVGPGDVEAFGLVFLEAARAGLPVVAYRHGGVPEAVLDGITGLLAPEGDVSALADRLERTLSDRRLAETLGAAGRARVVAEFDIDVRTRQLEALYDRVSV